MNSALPKVLVGLSGKPLIQHLLDNIKQVELENRPIIVVGFKYELVQSYLGKSYIYAFQEGQLGTAHAAAAALPKVTAENVLILYGDMPFIKAETILNLIKMHEENKFKFSMLTATVPNFENQFSSMMGFGRIVRDDQRKIKQIRELIDTTPEEKQIKEVNPGIYLFDTKWFSEHIEEVPKNKHGEHYLTDMVEIAIRNGIDIATAPVDPLQVLGVNTPAELEQAEKLLLSS